jgi:hypothetical protein
MLRSTLYSFIIPSRGTAQQGCQLTLWRRKEETAALKRKGRFRAEPMTQRQGARQPYGTELLTNRGEARVSC